MYLTQHYEHGFHPCASDTCWWHEKVVQWQIFIYTTNCSGTPSVVWNPHFVLVHQAKTGACRFCNTAFWVRLTSTASTFRNLVDFVFANLFNATRFVFEVNRTCKTSSGIRWNPTAGSNTSWCEARMTSSRAKRNVWVPPNSGLLWVWGSGVTPSNGRVVRWKSFDLYVHVQ